jgi:uroporphyrinogen-III synthase
LSTPLSGLRVVNTRAPHQAGELDRLLTERGAISVPFPCIAIVPPADPWDLDSALPPLVEGRFDWLVLTSVNTVYALSSRLRNRGLPVQIRSWTKVAAVGPATSAATQQEFGVEPEIVPATHTGVDLIRAIPVKSGESVLLPRSEIALEEIEVALRMRGAKVRTVIAYRTVVGEGGMDLPGMLADRQIDALTFCSSSAVDGFVSRFQSEAGSLVDATMLPTACIGPTTHATAIGHGFTSATSAETHTLQGLVAALDRIFSTQSQGVHRWL